MMKPSTAAAAQKPILPEECLPLVNLAVFWDGVVTLALLKYLGAAQEQCQKGQTRLKVRL
jgi:hypothetical protein